MSSNVQVEERHDSQELLMVDPETLDPEMNYRFVQVRPENVARKKLMGYRLVSRSKDGVKTLVDLEDRADDTIRIADTVLMCCPKSVWEARRRKKAQLVAQRLEATKNRLREKVEQARGRGVDVRYVDSYEDKGPSEKEEG